MENNNSEIKSTVVNSSRRKMLNNLVKAAPVISSMAVMPVWATNNSISGNLSGNLSGQYGVTEYSGRGPFDLACDSDLMNAYGSKSTKEHFKGYTGELTIEQLLCSQDASVQLERYAATACINAMVDINFRYQPQEIITFYENVIEGSHNITRAEGTAVLQRLTASEGSVDCS